ncbi:probable transmembrane reductase CYB561D1 isoform X2 [Anopheles aquasalis]|uniref:probable transmembrane reductase CYB561D1 isoform X2 n=1 Tax=Anopheles aquasalis TaxID=42839 RepID=UPI00215ABBB3|nr:probable transmembrane reductase CYB561D1 isoform X2 [Anopheles aquasalis]
MGKEGGKEGETSSSVPYDRLIAVAADDRERGVVDREEEAKSIAQGTAGEIRAVGNGGYQNGKTAAGMGAGERRVSSAEQEELFAEYRDEQGAGSEADDPEMDRNKRNGASDRAAGSPRFSRKLALLNVLANGLMFAVAGFITYHCFNKAMVLFSWHPSFMVIAYLILMSQAVLTMSGTNYFTHRCTHRTRVYIHWVLQAVAGILISIASVCIFLNKIRLGKAHFQTLHGIFGLVTVCATLASIAGGVTTKYAFQLRTYVRPLYSKLGHGIAGTVTYLLGITTIGLGVYGRWFQEDNDATVRLMLVLAIALIALYVIATPIVNTVQRIKTAARTTL